MRYPDFLALPGSQELLRANENSRALEELVERDREVADADAGGMIHGVVDRRRGADDA